MAELSEDAKSLLENHYGAQVRAAMPQAAKLMAAPAVAFSALDPDLVDAIHDGAIDFGLGAAELDWAVVIPQIIAAISTGSWFSLIPMFIKYGPAFLAFVKQIIGVFHQQPATGGGPVIGNA